MSALIDLATALEADARPSANETPTTASTPTSTELPAPANGTWLDEDIRLMGDEGALLRHIVLLTLGATPHRRDYREMFERRVECIVANALRAHFFRTSECVAYLRGNNDYATRPRWLSGSGMRSTADRIARAGLIELTPGRWGGTHPQFGRGCAATYRIAEPLLNLIDFCGASARTVGKPVPLPSSLIKLRAGQDDPKRLLPIKVTDETSSWTSDLDRYNWFADEHDVYIDEFCSTSEKKLLAAWNKKLAERSRQPGLTTPEFFNRHLNRIFNDGTFDHGGRLYGAWYQYVPKWMRRRITIDQRKTVELDFSGMSVRMLYHLNGIDYLRDPYELPKLSAYAVATGRPRKHFRGAIKKLIQAMLNNEDDELQPEMIELEASFRPKYTRVEVRDMILEQHGAISAAFGSGVGKRLQRLDSDIALEIIVSLMGEGILGLPIHDSFIVMRAHKRMLYEQMTNSYRSRMNFNPIIKINKCGVPTEGDEGRSSYIVT